MRRIEIFDTTLRDGEQSAGVNLHKHEKLEIAYQLEAFGVDVMEAGFPASSRGDWEAVKEIADRIKHVSVAGLARSSEKDIDAAWGALKGAANPRLHIFMGTSPIHMKYKFGMTPQEVLETTVASVRYAKKFFSEVEWSAEDATRSDWDFLTKVVDAVIRAGATVINLPDTVGYTTPQEYANMFRHIRNTVPDIDKVKLSAHCHDDLGMAVINTLSAIEAGVHQVEGTINGIGERAGNVALEEVALALATRKDFFQVETGLNLKQTVRTSRLVSKLTGMQVPPNKAVVGSNAFAHESGIHQDGVLKNKQTYEIISPEMVGLGGNSLPIGKHSGRHALRVKCEELGIVVSEEEFQQLFKAVKELTEKKKEVTDEDILALAYDASPVGEADRHYELLSLQVSYTAHAVSMTSVELRLPDGSVVREAATGNGSVEAIYHTIDRIVGATGIDAVADGTGGQVAGGVSGGAASREAGVGGSPAAGATAGVGGSRVAGVTGRPIELLDYRIQSATGGNDALAEVYVKVKFDGINGHGRAVDNDVLMASAKAYIDAVNRATALMSERAESEGAEKGRAEAEVEVAGAGVAASPAQV